MATRASSPPRSRSTSGPSGQATKPRSTGSKKSSSATTAQRPARPNAVRGVALAQASAGAEAPPLGTGRAGPRTRRRLDRPGPRRRECRPGGGHRGPGRRSGAAPGRDRTVPGRLRHRGRRRVLVGSARCGRQRHPGRRGQRHRHAVLRRSGAAGPDGVADAAPPRPQRSGRPAGGRLERDHARSARLDQHLPRAAADQRARAAARGGRHPRLHLLQPAHRSADRVRRRAVVDLAAAVRRAGRGGHSAAPDSGAGPRRPGSTAPPRRR